MRVFSSWWFAGSASLLKTAILVCLGTYLLSWAENGSELSAALAIVGTSRVEQAANGQQIDGQYPAMFTNEEDEVSDQLPKNAMLLRTLVLVLFYGPALGWLLLASSWRGSRPAVTPLSRCSFLSIVHMHQRRAVATLLGLFLL